MVKDVCIKLQHTIGCSYNTNSGVSQRMPQNDLSFADTISTWQVKKCSKHLHWPKLLSAQKKEESASNKARRTCRGLNPQMKTILCLPLSFPRHRICGRCSFAEKLRSSYILNACCWCQTLHWRTAAISLRARKYAGCWRRW